MSGNRTKVVLTRRLPEPVETRLKELFDVTLRDHDTPMSRAELVDAVKTCDVLVPTITDKIDAGLLGQAGANLKLIANFGAGIDHIDVETARQRGILVSNTPDVVTEDTAAMAMALLMAVVRKIPQGLQAMQSGEWTGWSPTAHLGGRLGGRRLGVLGMGRIGQARAARVRLACKSTITIVADYALRLRTHWTQPIGKVWTKWWHAWISSPSIVRIRHQPFI